ncbi:MAG TPA: hypothetical protein DCQ98_08140 [Planctomycetaceae bacterium]|nr:hypothetical protein [Planctomycetaceae bacterium]
MPSRRLSPEIDSRPTLPDAGSGRTVQEAMPRGTRAVSSPGASDRPTVMIRPTRRIRTVGKRCVERSGRSGASSEPSVASP